MTTQLPWALLFSTLKRADGARSSWAQLVAQGAQPQALLDAGVLTYDGLLHTPADCTCGVEPQVDVEAREAEGLVGFACVAQPACFRGWEWVPRAECEFLRFRASDVLAAAASRNGLAALEAEVSAPFTAVGLLRQRGLEVPVVWLSATRSGFEPLCLGLRAQLGRDGLVVLTARRTATSFPPGERIAVLELPEAEGGGLGLGRALDAFDPQYRTRAGSREHPELDLDFVTLHFATCVDRHLLTINGHLFDGFKKSDLLFAQLLMLAAARVEGRREGYRSKAGLVGDFAPQPTAASVAKADRALEKLRAELKGAAVPGLSTDELDALLKTERGSGRVRLAVPPHHITFDASLAQLQWKLPSTLGSAGKASASQDDGMQRASALLREARRLGAP